MSDDVLSVVPSDPCWQPDRATGQRVAELVTSLTLVDGDGGWCEVTWHDDVALVDCGGNLERIGCLGCGRQLDGEWWRDLIEERHTSGSGLADLAVVVPCCGAATTLDALEYDWPVAFARFEIAVWNPSRTFDPGDGRLDDDAAAAVERALGHPIRQVRAHY
ncbi:MAG: hypothetical protein HY830_09435 [Actinobacteria bacterium]|nr:hypothetical protein [Actinomycetota bacterium]